MVSKLNSCNNFVNQQTHPEIPYLRFRKTAKTLFESSRNEVDPLQNRSLSISCKDEKSKWPDYRKFLKAIVVIHVIGILMKTIAAYIPPTAVGYTVDPRICDPDTGISFKETTTCNPLGSLCSFDLKDRIITLMSVYDNSKDPARDVYTNLTNELNRQYAEKYGIDHVIINDAKKFTEKQCTDPLTYEKVNCELYWSKVYPFVQACDTYKASPPTDGKERWFFSLDTDGVLANDFDPYDFIDQVRVNEDGTPNDADFIVPQDSNPWTTNYLKKRAVHPRYNANTGFVAGRINSRSCVAIRKWWEARNSIPDSYHPQHCRTLGICPGQYYGLHEQQAIGVILNDYPCFKNLIHVMKVRDPDSKTRKDIAINGLFGHDKYCFMRCSGSECQGPFSFYENANHPHVYRSGDNWAQPNAFPTLGKVAQKVDGKCPPSGEWKKIPVEQVRFRLVRELCEQSSKKAICEKLIQGQSGKVVTANLWAGLGNQMFQVAAAYAHALDIGGIALFPDREVAHVKESPVLHKVLRTNVKIDSVANEWFKFIKLPSESVELVGFFQSPKYFNHRRKEILELFSPPEDIKKSLNNKYKDLLEKETVAVHVRRGDYLTYKNRGGAIMYNLSEDPEYYKRALKEFDLEGKYFVVFSDDIEFAKTIPAFKDVKNIRYISGQKPYEDFYLMSMCKDHITANSTFSWWAAYLSQNPDKKVVMPNKWFGPGFERESWFDPQNTKKIEGTKETCYAPPEYLPMDGWLLI